VSNKNDIPVIIKREISALIYFLWLFSPQLKLYKFCALFKATSSITGVASCYSHNSLLCRSGDMAIPFRLFAQSNYWRQSKNANKRTSVFSCTRLLWNVAGNLSVIFCIEKQIINDSTYVLLFDVFRPARFTLTYLVRKLVVTKNTRH
jgi:hypothetical protein